jgi:mannose-6-phosphate isomerase-like protein (cupin superfamily)
VSVRDKTPGVRRRREAYDDIAPDGSEIRLLVGAAEAATKAGLCEVTLAAGEVSRPVWHQTVEEIWYVLEGIGEVWRSQPNQSDAAPVKVAKGDALTIPTGWYFQFSASPAGPLRFLCYTVPPWPGPDEAKPAKRGGLGQPTR